ncbi:MAG TPA: PEGA domain-containing protein, partial [Caldisericia bacterium]|nr:PEGA domain-containing protein [Caldisericia bacterium]
EGTLIIKSNPSGATVYIKNKEKGLTPLTINLSPGSYNIRLEKENYLPYNDTIVIKENETIEKNYLLHQISKPGYLTVYSDPTNAQVYLIDINDINDINDISGKYIGNTPIINYKIEKGEYMLRVKKEGYRDFLTEKFTVEYGKEITFSDLEIILPSEKP